MIPTPFEVAVAIRIETGWKLRGFLILDIVKVRMVSAALPEEVKAF